MRRSEVIESAALRLERAAVARDNTQGEPIGLIEAKAELRDAAAALRAALAMPPDPPSDTRAALSAFLFQVVQGPVLERDACVTQAREALAGSELDPLRGPVDGEPRPLCHHVAEPAKPETPEPAPWWKGRV